MGLWISNNPKLPFLGTSPPWNWQRDYQQGSLKQEVTGREWKAREHMRSQALDTWISLTCTYFFRSYQKLDSQANQNFCVNKGISLICDLKHVTSLHQKLSSCSFIRWVRTHTCISLHTSGMLCGSNEIMKVKLLYIRLIEGTKW